MLDDRTSVTTPLTRPGAGTWVTLALFALTSWWGLWGAVVKHTTVPDGFGWFASVTIAGIAVSRWLAPYGAERLASTPGAGTGWFDLGHGASVGVALLLPGAACWFALRAVLAGRRGTMAGPLRKARSALASLWALWALAGTTGQIVMIWATLTNDPSSDLTPEAVLDVASLLNVIAIAALMCLEPKAASRLCRTTTVG